MSDKTRDQVSSGIHGRPDDPDADSTSSEELQQPVRFGSSYGTHALVNEVAAASSTLEELSSDDFLRKIREDAQNVAQERQNLGVGFDKFKKNPIFEGDKELHMIPMEAHLKFLSKPKNLDEWRSNFNYFNSRLETRLTEAEDQMMKHTDGSGHARTRAAAHLYVASDQASKFHLKSLEYLGDLVEEEIKRKYNKQFENTGPSRTQELYKGYQRRHRKGA
ncbi:MAG: hypothetical protein Q9162_003108 [Coniocarpon cinnabarinum]